MYSTFSVAGLFFSFINYITPPFTGFHKSLTVFLDAFTKLQKVTVNFIMAGCLSIHMEQFGSHWTDVHEI